MPLLDTYEVLLDRKPTTRPQSCPYDELGCDQTFLIGRGLTTCSCSEQRAIWSTDALRIHERFHDVGTNGEAFGEVMQVWERLLLVHLLRNARGTQVLNSFVFLDTTGRLSHSVDDRLASVHDGIAGEVDAHLSIALSFHRR